MLRAIPPSLLLLACWTRPAHAYADAASPHPPVLSIPHPLPRSTLIVKYGGSAITHKGSFETLNKEALHSAAQQIATVFEEGVWDDVILVHGAGSFGHFHAKQFGLKSGGSSNSGSSGSGNGCGGSGSSGSSGSGNGSGSGSGSGSDSSSGDWRRGLALTRQSVQKLNALVVAAHVEALLPAVGISLFPTTVTGLSLQEGSGSEDRGGGKDSTDSSIISTTTTTTTTTSSTFCSITRTTRTSSSTPTSPSPSPINPSGCSVLLPGALGLSAVLGAGLLPVLHGDVVLDQHQRCAILGGDHIITW
ncbi:Aspartate/glutamate/uridylate kinase [Ochromonadaceae sp. CCMP2298]|nr:Aspartate/glutamate/uridylate kinase [Ochromonadaceae sp. CCMP2298]